MLCIHICGEKMFLTTVMQFTVVKMRYCHVITFVGGYMLVCTSVVQNDNSGSSEGIESHERRSLYPK